MQVTCHASKTINNTKYRQECSKDNAQMFVPFTSALTHDEISTMTNNQEFWLGLEKKSKTKVLSVYTGETVLLRLDTAVVVVVSRVYLQIGTRSESEN